MTVDDAVLRVRRPGDYNCNIVNARFTWGATNVYSAFEISKLIERRTTPRISIEAMETLAFSSLSEDSFAEDWNSPEDAIYDDL